MRTDSSRHVSARGAVVLVVLIIFSLGCSMLSLSPQDMATQTAIAGLQASMAAVNDQRTATQAAAETAAHSSQATGTAQAITYATLDSNLTATGESAVSNADVPGSWKLVLYDPFDSNTYGWPEAAENQSQFAAASYEISDGMYKYTVRSRQGVEGWFAPSALVSVNDFYVSVKASLSRDEPGASYGIVFRLDPSTHAHYGFVASESGGYAVYIYNKAGVSNTLKSGRTDRLVKGGNTLAVKGVGSQFTFYINGSSIANISDARLDSGTVGLAVGVNYRGVELNFQFDDFTVLKP